MNNDILRADASSIHARKLQSYTWEEQCLDAPEGVGYEA
jgi:hypothetical protein